MANVLVIDDSRDMLTMLRMILERRGEHTVHESLNGPEGLEIAYRVQPDIAIVDVMMPGMDGYTVVRRLRADPRTKSIGIIVLTARGQPVDQQAALAAGANTHMSKPVDVPRLLTIINELLPGNTLPTAANTRMPNKFIIPVFSTKGGVGVTTLAVNLAVLMQQVGQTILWDLSPNSGHCALMSGMRPQKHWGQLTQNPQIPVGDLLMQHESGVRLLAAPPIPVLTQRFDVGSATKILTALQKLATFVIVDMSSCLDEVNMHVLEQSHRIIFVTGDTPAAIQSSLATLQRLRDLHPKMLVMRNTTNQQIGPSLDVMQRTLKLKLQGDIGFESAQTIAERKGTPLATSEPNAPLVMTLKRAAQLILTP